MLSLQKNGLSGNASQTFIQIVEICKGQEFRLHYMAWSYQKIYLLLKLKVVQACLAYTSNNHTKKTPFNMLY